MNNNENIEDEEQRENERKAELKNQKDLDVVRDYKGVFNGVRGKRVLFDLMRSCSFINTTISPDIAIMAYKEGRRSVVLDIIKITGKKESAILDFFKQQTEKMEEEYT